MKECEVYGILSLLVVGIFVIGKVEVSIEKIWYVNKR